MKIRVNNLNLHYESAGEQNTPTLICLHGISSNSRSWRNQLTGLSTDYRVIAWDARGYGQSADPPAPFTMAEFADDIAGLMDGLNLGQAVIIGLSMGGVIAQEFYRRYADRVQALIVADTNMGGGARLEAERRVRLEARLKALETQTPAEMARLRAPALLSPQASPELLAEVVAMVSEIHPLGYRYAAIALDAADTSAVLPTVKVPTLVLWGDYDTVTPLEETRIIAETVPRARFEIIPGAGHLSNLEQPARFNQAVHSFLQGIMGK